MTEQEIKQLENLRAELSLAKNKIVTLQQEMKQLEETIYLNCEHKWEKDRTNVGEHTEYICFKCQMYKK